MKKIYTIVSIAFIVPSFAFAVSTTISTLAIKISGYLNQALVVLMGVALVIFVWNIIKYFIKGNEDHKEAAPYVMWSIIGFFVILSLWGIVNVLKNTFFSDTDTTAPSWSSFSRIFPSGGNSSGSNMNTAI